MSKRRLLIAATVSAIAIVGVILFYVARLNRAVSDEEKLQRAAAQVDVLQTRLRPPSSDGIAVYLNPGEVRAVATLQGVRYLATSGGLIALDDADGIKRRYTNLDGLPDNDLTALATFRNRLFIGTATHGLIAFDGNAFTGFTFSKPRATRVQALATTETELLIGTLDGGLFECDGEHFSRRFNSTAGADFRQVTALLPVDSRLYIGTQDDGLYIWREAHIEHIAPGAGLPSPHVTGLAALPGGWSSIGVVAVATDFGAVGVGAGNELKPISSRPNITSLAFSGGRLWAGLLDGGVIDLDLERGSKDTRHPAAGADVAGLPRASATLVQQGEGGLWALASVGAFYRDGASSAPGFTPVGAALVGERVLTGNHITGLAVDGGGWLWVGYFDRGIDVISPQTNERLSHIEDDRVREINFLKYDGSEDQTYAATSRGLIIFDARMKQTALTREQSGLINDSVAHVSFQDVAVQTMPAAGGGGGNARDRALVLPTAGGLTEILAGRARSLTAFHGLASNHLYASAASGSRLFVGSLAGLVELEGLRVVRTYKTANSRLSHDWVTALAEADGVLYVGTNGGGVDALLPTGEWINFADDIGRFEVNQNAMWFDGLRLYVGSSDRGLFVYNTRGRRWTRINSSLPSQNVTAIAEDDQYVYVGSLNGLTRIEKRIIE